MIAIDINMPKCCPDCPCGDSEWMACSLTREPWDHNEDGNLDLDNRPSWCPLIDLTCTDYCSMYRKEVEERRIAWEEK